MKFKSFILSFLVMVSLACKLNQEVVGTDSSAPPVNNNPPSPPQAPTPAESIQIKSITETSDLGSTLPAIEVEVYDEEGQLYSGDDLSMTISLSNDPTGSAILSGTLTVSVINGVATFSDLSLNLPANGYEFTFTLSGLPSVSTPPVVVSNIVEKSIGSAGRDFSSMQAWEDARNGDLTDRSVLSVTAGAGTFQAGETVTANDASCSGIYRPEDEAVTNGNTMTLDGLTGTCTASVVLGGGTSAATANFNSVLVAGEIIEKGLMHADSVFTDNVQINGSTTNSKAYMWLTANDYHSGIAGAGVVVDPNVLGHVIDIRDDYTHVEKLELTGWPASGSSSYEGMHVEANNTLAEFMLIHDDDRGAETNPDSEGYYINQDNTTNTLRNSIIYNMARACIHNQGGSNRTLNIYNVVVHRCVETDNSPGSYGAVKNSGGSNTFDARNVVVTSTQSGAPNFAGNFSGSSTNNVSTDGLAPGTNPMQISQAQNMYVNTGSGTEDFHAKPGSWLKNLGADLSHLFSRDIDLQIRYEFWDAGADNISVGGSEPVDPGQGTAVVKTVGSAGRQFSTIQSWQDLRGGRLTQRRSFSVTPGAGNFSQQEVVLGQSSGCQGIYIPEDEALTNSSTMTIDDLSGICQAGEVLEGQTSGATATFQSASSNNGTIEVAHLYPDSVFVENIVLDSMFSDADHYSHIMAAPGFEHNGVAGAGPVINPTGYAHAFIVHNNFIRFSDFEVRGWENGVSGNSRAGFAIYADQVQMDKMLIHSEDRTGGNPNGDGVEINRDGVSFFIRNSVFYNISRSGVMTQRDTGVYAQVENCTFHNTGITGADGQGSVHSDSDVPWLVKNSFAWADTTTDFTGSFAAGSTNNASVDASAPGAAAQTLLTASDQFVDLGAGTEDFNLKVGADLIGNGANLSGDFTDDITGAVRGTPWDIGAFSN